MALPGDLNTVTVTGSFLDASGTALTGSVTFTPVAVLAAGSPAVPVTVTDSTGHVVIAAVGVTRLVGPIPPSVGRVPATPPLTYPPSWPAQPLSVILAATDNADLSPQNWAYQASVIIGDAPVETFTTLLPHSPPTIDFSDLVPATLAVSLSAALPITGGVLSGTLELGGSPALQIPAGAGAGDVLVSDAEGNASWDTLSAAGLATTTALAAETSRAEAAEALKAPLASPALTGTPTAPTKTALTDSTAIATTAYTDAAVAAETSRAETAEAAIPTTGTPLAVDRGGSGSGAQNWTGLLTPTTQTGAYTANPGDLVKANISSAGWTLKLPNAPAANTVVGAKVIAQVTTGTPNTLTVECNPSGSDVFEQSGGGTSVTMSLPLQAAAWQYNSGYWTRVSDDLPLGQLGGLYASVFSPLAYGAKGNTKTVTDGAITSGLTALTSASAGFTSADTGKSVYVLGAGPAGATLATTISAWVSSTQVTVAASAGTTVTGATVNWGTDDTTAVQAAFTAAHTAGGGTVDVGSHVFLTSSAVSLHSNLRVKGAGPQGAQNSAGAIVNNTSDLFSLASTISNVEFDHCALTATAGHIWNAENSLCSFWEITNTYCSQASNSHSIWYQPNVSGSAASQAYSDMLIGDGCYFTCPAGDATVPPWYVITQANINSNTWRRLQASTGNSSGVPFFYLENVGTSDFDLASDNVFEDITGEENAGGIIKALSVNNLTIRNVQGWDTEFLGSVFTIGTSTTGLQPSGDIVIINSGRRGAYISGCYDVQASSDTTNLVLVNVDPRPLTAAGALALSVPQSTTVIPAQAYTPTAYLNSAAGGTSGTAATTGNSGGSSGAVLDDVTGTVTFSNSQTLAAGLSGLSYKFAPSAASAYVYWVPGAGTGTGVIPAAVQYMRCYIYVSSFPSANMSVLSLSGLNYYIGYSPSATAWYAYAYPGTAVNSIAPASTATWYRLEAAFNQAQGTTTLRVCSAGGVLLDEVTGTGGTATGSTNAYFGSQTAVTSTFWLAYLAWSNTGWIGA